MPIVAELDVITQKKIHLSTASRETLPELFHQLLRNVEPDFSQYRSMTMPVKPFSCALRIKRSEKADSQIIPAQKPFQLIIRILVEELEPRIAHLLGVLSTGEQTLPFLDGELQVLPFHDASSVMIRISNTTLMTTARPDSAVEFQFLSPTLFHDRHGNSYIPEPVFVYRSLARKWKLFGDPTFRIDPDVIASKIRITRYQLQTAYYEMGSFRQLGFIGTVNYDLKQVPEDQRRTLHLLANYTQFAGIGTNTQMGMGICRAVSKPLP